MKLLSQIVPPEIEYSIQIRSSFRRYGDLIPNSLANATRSSECIS